MRISIVGLGKMGETVLECAREQKLNIASTIDPFNPAADFKSVNAESLKNTDICICFTLPQAAMDNIRDISALGRHIVMATTGWEKQLDEARNLIESNGVGMIYSTNFSIGVNLFFKLVESAGKLFRDFEQYDVMGWEMHHNRKVDAPSGTAKTIENILLENIRRKTDILEDRPDGKVSPEQIHFASIRGGDIPGEHHVRFDSEGDSIQISHIARSRKGFAQGALLAANWIADKKGMFTESDLIAAYLDGAIK